MVKRPAIITGVTVVFCALLCSGIVFADDDASIDDVSIVVPTACTLSGAGTGTHTATINPGQYVADIGTTTLKALCNDANGFAIYATGYTGNTIGETNSNKLVGQNTSETIVTGLATSGNTSNWAMKLATDSTATYPITIESAPNTSGGSDASFSAYHVVPNEYTKVATRLQSTDVGTTATGSTLTTTYATYVSAGQVGDTYNGKVIYTLVHPNNHAAPQVPKVMQDVATWGNTVSQGEEILVKDSRDDKVYTAAVLSDGNMWMTQNLDFDIDATRTYTPADTDLLPNTTWTPSRSTYTAGSEVWCEGGQAYRGECSNNTPESTDLGERYWSGERNVAQDCGHASCIIANTLSSGDSHYAIGNYYNYTAAFAVNDTSDYYDLYGDNEVTINHSVCPAGWKLPSLPDFENLVESTVNSFVGDDYFGAPTFFTAFGWLDGSTNDLWYPRIGYEADYMTSTYSYGYYYYVFLDSASADVYQYNLAGMGVPIRCMARTP